MNRHSRHHHHEGLTGEHPFGDAGQVILLIVFFAVWILDSFILKYTVFLTDRIPLFLRLLIAVPVFYVCYRFAARSMHLIFGNEGDSPRVLDEDVFAVMRHPLYFAALLGYAAFFLLTLSLAALAVACIAFLFYNYIAAYEERLLIKRFGRDYQEYSSRVPRWPVPFGKPR